MNVEFTNKNLEKLYTSGKSSKYKLQPEVLNKFFMRIQQIEAAVTTQDLINQKGLNFEKLTVFSNRYSIRLNKKYRLEMEIKWTNTQLTVGDFYICELSNHYD